MRHPNIVKGLSVLFIGTITAAYGQGEDPFIGRGDRGEIIHVLPGPSVRNTAHGRPQPLFDSTGPTAKPQVYSASYGSGNLINHGGPEISNAAFYAVYWNSTVAGSTQTTGGGTIQNLISSFVASFSGSGNYTSNANYSTTDYTIVQQYGAAATPIVYNLVYAGSTVDNQPFQSTITDSAIQTWLAGLFNNNKITPNANTIYGTYFPSGTTITLGGSSSCTSFCGYHSNFLYNGMQIKYAVFPYPNCSGCSLSTDGLTVGDMLTIVGSHEIREAVTDSLGTAWFDSSGYEADDKCVWHNLYKMVIGSYWVQPEYSNALTGYPGPGCIVP